MPSSINENAHTSIEPKAMGVKTRRKMRTNFMILLSIISKSNEFEDESTFQSRLSGHTKYRRRYFSNR